MRKIWLNKKTWGAKELDKTNNLYHAVNALVAANLTPAYVEIVYDNIRLQQIYREHHKTISNEYIDYLNKSINKMQNIMVSLLNIVKNYYVLLEKYQQY